MNTRLKRNDCTFVAKNTGYADIKTTVNTYCDIFTEYEQKHIDTQTEYLRENGLSIATV